jgi:hypothetical protein
MDGVGCRLLGDVLCGPGWWRSAPRPGIPCGQSEVEGKSTSAWVRHVVLLLRAAQCCRNAISGRLRASDPLIVRPLRNTCAPAAVHCQSALQAGGSPEREERIVIIVSQSTAEYPPRVWENNNQFTPPGPVTSVLANYLTMCAPRSRLHQP